MIDDSHTAYEPHPTAAMERQHRDDVVIRPETICTLKVYSEAAYRKLDDEYARLRELVGTALKVIPRRYEDLPPVKKSRVIRDVKAVLETLQEAGDE